MEDNVLIGSEVFTGKSQTKVKLSLFVISNGNTLVTSAVNATGPMFEIFNVNTGSRSWLISSLL